MIARHLYIAPPPEDSDKKPTPATKYQLLLALADGVERDELAGYLHGKADVFFARNNHEAAKFLENQPIHLVITNGSLGDHGLCRQMKQSCRWGHIPVVELIPRGSFAIQLQCLESGVDACLEKPVSRHLLLAQINNLLTNRARIKAHRDQPATPESPAVSLSLRTDEALWKRLHQLLLKHLSNPLLDIDMLARHLYISRPTLYRKIAEMSNMSPSELITLARLNQAAILLSSPEYPIGDIARLTGFITRSGFGKAFHKRFHMTPSEYRRKAHGLTQRDASRHVYLSPI